MKGYFKIVAAEYKRVLSHTDMTDGFAGVMRDVCIAVIGVVYGFLQWCFVIIYLLFGLWWFYPLTRAIVARRERKNLRANIKKIKAANNIRGIREFVGKRASLYPDLRTVKILCKAADIRVDAIRRAHFAALARIEEQGKAE